jgi:hypothetical protein
MVSASSIASLLAPPGHYPPAPGPGGVIPAEGTRSDPASGQSAASVSVSRSAAIRGTSKRHSGYADVPAACEHSRSLSHNLRREYTQSMSDMTTIKVSVETRDRLKKLADEDHLTLDAELARALDKAEEARFWAGVRADYARLQADPEGWAGYVGELAEWDHTAGDGLGGE